MFYIPIPLAPPILLVVLVPDFYFSTFKVLIDNRDKPNPYETVEEIGKKEKKKSAAAAEAPFSTIFGRFSRKYTYYTTTPTYRKLLLVERSNPSHLKPKKLDCVDNFSCSMYIY